MIRSESRDLALFLLLTVACLAGAHDTKPDSLDRNYAAELPRIKPVEPGQALATFKVAEGFRIEQAACEPVVVDPVAMAFDENGRLYVVEMRGYSEDGGDNLGRIRLLIDADDDGRYETSHIFADGLSWPTAVTCWDGGIFVGAAPDIMYLKDTDGNHQADLRRVVFTGFGRGNVQGLINTFKWGLDNRIHGATSSSGAQVRAVLQGKDWQTKGHDDVEKPVGDALTLRGRDFAFDPHTLEIEATSGGGQHGMSFNRWGEKFVCQNSSHAQHVRFEDRYIARNAYFAAPSAKANIALDGPQADVFRSSPIEPWRIVRTRLRVQKLVPGPVEGGGTPAGYFTGSTGITIYRGDAWPHDYLGWAIVGDVGSNLIHRKRLEPRGATYAAHRVDEKSEFITSTDIWFRPVQFSNAPDGSLYVADMYRETIEHPLSLPPIIKQHLDLTSGRDRGRIYRIIPTKFERRSQPQLGALSTSKLVSGLMLATNGWQRETISRLLTERQDLSAAADLESAVEAWAVAENSIAAAYVLRSLGVLSEGTVLTILNNKHPRVREHGLRLSESLASESSEIREKLYSMRDDEELRVRYQLAFTLGELVGPRRIETLAAIVKSDGNQDLMRVAVMSSLGEGAGDLLAGLAGDSKFRKTPAGQGWINALAAQIGKQQRPDDVATVLDVLGSLPKDEKQTLQAIVQGLAAKPGSELSTQLAAVTGGQAARLMAGLLQASAKTAADDSGEVADRVAATQRLRLGKLAGSEELFASLLQPAQPGEVQAAAIATLARFDSPEVVTLLLGQWSSLSPRLRQRAGDVLFSRESWLPTLLDAAQAGRVSLNDLEPTRLRLLASHADESIRTRAKELLDKHLGNRAEVLKAYRGALDAKGDPARGKLVFKKTCSQCHRLEGVGHEIGPNLAAMRNRGPEAILTNVLAPNQEVNPQYLNYAMITADGRSLTGMIAAESATSVTLRRAENAKDTILRIDIDEFRSTGLSLMPEGLEKQVSPESMADLLAYLLAVQ